MVKKMKKWLAELLRSVAYRLSSPLEGMVYYSQEYKIVPICFNYNRGDRHNHIPNDHMEDYALEAIMKECKQYLQRRVTRYDTTFELLLAVKEYE